MTRRPGWIGGMTVAVLVGALPASAGAAAGGYMQENLVSDQPGVAQLTDPQLVNAWGMSRGPNTPVWVSDNGADVSTLYNGAVPGNPESPVAKVLMVSIPGGAPTGQVFNDTTAFLLPGTTTAARFIFIGEDGDLSAWAGGPAATLVGHTRRRGLQGPRARAQPVRPDAARGQLPRQPHRRLRQHVHTRGSCRDVQRSHAAAGLRAVQRGRARRPDLRDLRPAGRRPRGRRRRPGARVRRRLLDLGRVGEALRHPRRAQLAVGHDDRAGELRSVQRRPADRQLRRRADPRLRSEHRRGARHPARHVRASRSPSTACGG